MSIKKCDCIILRGDKFGETKKVVTFFSLEYGKKKGVASGLGKMKSQLGASLDVITNSSLVFYESRSSELHRISQCDTIKPFAKLKEDLDKLKSAIYITELVRECIPFDEPLPEIYGLFMFFLEEIDGGNVGEGALRVFEARLLNLLGVLPTLNQCAECGKAPEAGKSVFCGIESSIICSKCRKGQKGLEISLGGLFFIRSAASLPLSKTKNLILGAYQEQEVRNLLHCIIISFIDKELQSYRFLYA